MREEEAQEVRKEAGWTISNAANGGSPQQILYLVSKGAIEAFCNLLETTDIKSLVVALEGIDNILHAGEKDNYENPYAKKVESCRGTDLIEELQSNDDNDVSKRATRIMEKYFEADLDAPIDEGESQFNFSFPSFKSDITNEFKF